jgi:hypothetical protein
MSATLKYQLQVVCSTESGDQGAPQPPSKHRLDTDRCAAARPTPAQRRVHADTMRPVRRGIGGGTQVRRAAGNRVWSASRMIRETPRVLGVCDCRPERLASAVQWSPEQKLVHGPGNPRWYAVTRRRGLRGWVGRGRQRIVANCPAIRCGGGQRGLLTVMVIGGPRRLPAAAKLDSDNPPRAAGRDATAR